MTPMIIFMCTEENIASIFIRSLLTITPLIHILVLWKYEHYLVESMYGYMYNKSITIVIDKYI